MLRRLVVMLAVITVVTCALGATTTARAEVTLKIGTLAPKESPWGKVFTVWQKGFKERTGGAAEIQFFFNGTQGDEAAMVGKIRTGQLDGAAVTAIGLGQIYKQVLILQVPGLFSSWEKLDAARTKLKPTIDAEFEKAGFKNLGEGDVGVVHIMSKGFPVRVPADLKKRGTCYFQGDPIVPTLFSLIGEVTPRAVQIPEVTGNLTSGAVNVVISPSLAAEQLQWSPQLTHINTLTSSYAIGALVFSSAKVKSLPADVQTALQETGAITGKALTNSIRAADKAAYERLAVGNPKANPPVPPRMTPYSPTEAEKAEWNKLANETKNKLKGNPFDASLMAQVEAAGK
ncbi:TRAP transporter substrate-binding protein DctP [Pendulispora albinea]|uniref:TRAP transporter substrate-binding protein DctP n=1 Tax=Pendulispora albinea TaxID=2741071 RepID=A0ABZ2LV96_9BACT